MFVHYLDLPSANPLNTLSFFSSSTLPSKRFSSSCILLSISNASNIASFLDNDWHAPPGYCFVKPLKEKNPLNVDLEKPLQGIVKYSDGTVEVNDLVGFRPSSEYEFIIDGERLYRILSNFITIKYEHQGDEEEYNPSWAQSS